MGLKAGTLLWRRARLTLTLASTDVDTLLTQLAKPFSDMSPNEPTMGTKGTVGPAPGALPASRIMVIPMAPTAGWALVTHGEPYFNTTTNTEHVVFANNSSPLEPTTINVLFWDPHSIVGPGQADTYNAAIEA